jgi:hypothetical protein
MQSILKTRSILIATVVFIGIATASFTRIPAPVKQTSTGSENREQEAIHSVTSWRNEANEMLSAVTGFLSRESAESPATAPSDPILEYILSLRSEDFTTYIDPDYDFSFHYPKDFVISTFQEDPGETIVAKHPRFQLGFQIFVTPFEEENPITKERILRDVPSLTIKDEVEFSLDDGTSAFRFSSEDSSLGETREIWFSRDGNLFQIMLFSSSPKRLDSLVRQFASDLTFVK